MFCGWKYARVRFYDFTLAKRSVSIYCAPVNRSATAPALSVRHLSKRFGDRVAFNDVSFEIGYGEVFGFLGPNGAGKTTTVRTPPTSGSAAVVGLPLMPENGVEIRRRIAIMPESPGLFLRLRIVENLACFADLYEVPDANDRIASSLEAVNLADRAQDTCGTLSKGLRQRVALKLATTLLPSPIFAQLESALRFAAWALSVS